MGLVTFPESYPTSFWLIAIIWSAYQGYAGCVYGLYISDQAPRKEEIAKVTRMLAYAFHHGAFYFLTSLSGFVAWSLLCSISEKISNWSEVAAGSGAILVALGSISAIGVSGALARLLYLGKHP